MTGTLAPKLGVRQGDNLSPNLFKISINNLPNIFSERDDQVELDSIHISSLLYADDLNKYYYLPQNLVFEIVQISLLHIVKKTV